MIKTKGVVHFSIPVTDTKRAKTFYKEHLGLTEVADVGPLVFLDSNGDSIVLVKVDGPISTAHVRNVHHSFLVDHDDYESAKKELAASGVKVLYEEDRREGVIDGPRVYFEDPDGNTLEIIDLTAYATVLSEHH
jgi:catechol 2,3-dioxygenase-like lactoylglutathione lyase family enzyme